MLVPFSKESTPDEEEDPDLGEETIFISNQQDCLIFFILFFLIKISIKTEQHDGTIIIEHDWGMAGRGGRDVVSLFPGSSHGQAQALVLGPRRSSEKSSVNQLAP